MNDVILRAVMVVTGALTLYSVGVITEQRRKEVSSLVLVFLTGGVLLDITSTVLMFNQYAVHGTRFTGLFRAVIDAD